MENNHVEEKPVVDRHLIQPAYVRPTVVRSALRSAALFTSALGLCSCVASESPLLTETKPVVGQHFAAQLFRNFSDGRAHEMRMTAFEWKDGAYRSVGAGTAEIASFVAQPLQGDDSIIQSADAGGKLFRYWIGRKLMDGAFLIFPLDETSLKVPDKSALCAKSPDPDVCIVDNKASLVKLARATASKPVTKAEIAVLVDRGPGVDAESPAVR